MSVLAKNHRQLILFYDSTNDLGRKCLAHAESAGKKMLAIDLKNTKVTGTEWSEIAGLLKLRIIDLIAQDHPIFKELYGDENVDLEEHDALKILEKNPETIAFPIVVKGDLAIQAKSTGDMKQLIEPDTGEIPQP